MIGTILDKYEVLQKVGEGGMATVYRGRHNTLNRDVAIKVLHPHLSSSTRNRQRFEREARAIEQLRHANILEIFDYSGADSGECYIVTEFVGGETLSQLLQRSGRLPCEMATRIGYDLARALDYAHRAGVLHRDLKPDNVMVRADGTVKLMDFGIARFLDESQVTMTGALVGSPAFMSPEQAREQNLDQRSDLFSLGTLLYYLVVGALPFTGSNPSLILKNIIEGNRPHVSELAPGISATLADVIERLLQGDREQRPPTAGSVADSLLLVLQEVDIELDDPAWSIRAYLDDATDYGRRLDVHLRAALLAKGRSLLSAGDPLQALRLLNRLLSIDEDNAEVMRLIATLHAEPKPRRPVFWVAGAAVGFAGVAALVLLFAAWQWDTAPHASGSGTEEAVPVPDVGTATRAETTRPVVPVETRDADESPTESSEVRSSSPSEPTTLSTAKTHTGAVLPKTPIKPAAPTVGRGVEEGTGDAALSVSPPVPVGRGHLEVRSDIWAWIEIDGIGQSRKTTEQGAIALPAGKHKVRVYSPYVEEQTLEVDVRPGVTSKQFFDLFYKPMAVTFSPVYASGCEVEVNGRPRGTVGELGRRVELRREDATMQTILVRCIEGTYTRSFDVDPEKKPEFGPQAAQSKTP